ncbi:MAG: peptidylprolyl isomerase [Rhodospirillales bacterium]
MTMKRLYKILSFVVLAAFGSAAHAQQDLRIAAIVNDEIISYYDLQNRLNLVLFSSARDASNEERQRLVPQILRTLIDDKLKLQEAERRNIQVTQSEIDRAIEHVEKTNNIGKGKLDSLLEQQGIPHSAVVAQIKAEIAWNKVANRVLGTQIRISEEEINERLAEVQENKNKPEHRISEIFLPVDSLDQEEKTKNLAERLHQQLQKGASFASLARSFSRSPTAGSGGHRGWVRQGALGKTVDAELTAMQPGGFSSPIKTEMGFFIVFLHERRTPDQVRDSQADANTTVTLQQLFLPLPAKAKPSEKASQLNLAKTLASTVLNCQDMEKAGKELGSPLSGKIGTVTMAKLPVNIRTAISDLPVNKTSVPVEMKSGLVILMVCDRVKPKVPEKPKVDERREVEMMLLNERLRTVSRRFLRDLRRSAFIDIRI